MKTIRVKWLNWVVVLRPTADLLGGHETEELSEAFRSNCAEHYQGIVLNLSDVRRVSSVGLGVLLQCATEAQRMGAKVAFCGIPMPMDEIMRMLRITLRQAYQTEEEAVRFCSER